LIEIYGVGYAGHPRLTTLLAINSIQPKDFLTGEKEAQAFVNRDFVALHQSTLRKVDILSDILERAHDRHLRTNTTWWEMHGGRFKNVLNWVAENKLFALILAVAAIIIGILPLLRKGR
jgi:hypothetical protein